MSDINMAGAGSAKKSIKIDLRKYMMVMALVIIWIVFTVLTRGSYFTPRNLTNLFRQAVFTAILATGMFPVIVLGQIDLTVGSIAALAGGLVGMLTTWMGLPFWFAVAIALIAGMAVGIWNGFWVAYRGVPAFIATLSSMLVFRAVLLGMTDGITISPMPEILKGLGAGFLSPVFGYVLAVLACVVMLFIQWNGRSKKIKMNLPTSSLIIEIIKTILTVGLLFGFMYMMASYKGIPVALMIILILFVIFQYVFSSTVFGRRIYAIGGNANACQLAGINIKASTMIVFAMNGVVAAIAGIFLSSRLNSASSAAASGAELDAIAACVIGGISMLGGIGTISGVMIGALVIQSIQNGMSLLDTPSFWQNIVKGLVLLVAVWFDISRKNK
ncbi:MAG: sugar ABC transporter permease [Spirochaetales bacterium]|uniref:Xylose transport system permease protein XylH n=1 Tax=Candidatus Thalassospirochaeta sargassi TaxID=3119039 RepID=A0AAJ1MIZ1_9SPIO|nr:sugar ABC transporter permease [Spirochaetales bacterium]